MLYNNKLTINNSLSRVGGSKLLSSNYWSSSEYNYAGAWALNFGQGSWSSNYKDFSLYVRPVIAF